VFNKINQFVKYFLLFIKYFVINFNTKKDIYYVVESSDWSIKHDGMSITKNLPTLRSLATCTSLGIKNSVVHFGSINTFFKKNRLIVPHKSNKIIVTWFHIPPHDKKVKLIPEALKYVNLWHTSCQITKDKLIHLGIPNNKIIIIPLGVDLKIFYKPTETEKNIIKKQLKLPKDKIIIGSFQKDGIGWGKGLVPKLIKGPDLFCDVVERLAMNYNIFVLLTGPARGYVKKRLQKAKIPYLHHYLKYPNDVAKYYKVIDLYVITSRHEGGPKAILESMASGVPLVSTKVGMAPEVIRDRETAMLCDVDNITCLVEKCSEILYDADLREKLIENSQKVVVNYSWDIIAWKYYDLLYKRFFK
jgi:glycosyltransferase involved in cell wall biosynthesis